MPGRKRSGDRSKVSQKRHRYVRDDRPARCAALYGQPHERAHRKNGQKYGHRSAFCLETQHFPDCIHHPDWPSCVLRAGEVFDSKTIYSFTTE
ncbi:MAG: hypothetical protein ACLU3I_12705 [Acutalibacteraceae bacterium]